MASLGSQGDQWFFVKTSPNALKKRSPTQLFVTFNTFENLKQIASSTQIAPNGKHSPNLITLIDQSDPLVTKVCKDAFQKRLYLICLAFTYVFSTRQKL
jgi:hypothetical protein